mgnify:CR=1 FL=1
MEKDKHLGLHIDRELHYKLQYVSKYDGRSVSGEVLYLLRRYIADFERLLKDVGRNDSDNVMTQTYLTSDTGKVYTMLAHAAGRFD